MKINKQFHLINFPSTTEGFGKELYDELINSESNVTQSTASDYLLDLGNGFDKPAQLVTSSGIVPVTPETVVFMRRRKPLRLYSSLLTQFFIALNATVLNKARYVEHYDNISKQAQSINLVKNGFRIPRTLLFNGEVVHKFQSYIESQLSYPMVLKGKGSCGNEVWKVHSFMEILEHLNTVTPDVKEATILQEFITNSAEEYRIVFMCGEILAVIVRSSEGFLNNHAQGGNLSTIELPPEEIERCKGAARISGLDYLGVDYMKNEDGAMIFLELQTGPSLTVTKEINANVIKKISDTILGH